MIYSKPTNTGVIPYSTVKIDGCSEAKLGFDFLSEQPSVGKRRYCNKVLVHECVSVPEIAPLELERVELVATDDPCYKFFNIFKSSEEVDSLAASIELQLDDDDKVIGIIITFQISETCCQPLSQAYKLYGFDLDGERILLANGNLVITPCPCPDGTMPVTWEDIRW